MRLRLRSAGLIGTMMAVIAPELAITTATVVLTPSVAEAQAGGVHRRTRRRTRRRTAAVVHTADMNQAAAQQQQQQPPPQEPPPEQPQQSQGPEVEPAHVVASALSTHGTKSARGNDGASTALIARAPPDPVRRTPGAG